MALLTLAEENTLHDLDHLVDWYKENKPEVNSIVVTQRQYNALMRISQKAEKQDLLRRQGDLDIKQNIYRGFEIVTKEQRKRHKRKDTIDIDELLEAAE